MKKLWIRFILWWNGVCPKHGPLPYERGATCVPCEANKWMARRKKAIAEREILWKRYGGL